MMRVLLCDGNAAGGGGVVVDVPHALAIRCHTLRELCEDVPDATGVVPLPRVAERTFRRVIEYARLAAEHGEMEAPADDGADEGEAATPGDSSNSAAPTAGKKRRRRQYKRIETVEGCKIVEEWRRAFIVSVAPDDAASVDDLITLTVAAEFLNYERLEDICLRRHAQLLEGKPVDHVRALYHLPDDLSSAQKAQIERDHAWTHGDDADDADDDDDDFESDLLSSSSDDEEDDEDDS